MAIHSPKHPLEALGFETEAHPLCALGFAPATVTVSSPAPPAMVVKGALVKGARVRLADGAVARVRYVDPGMRIVRVRTEDGRNLTVRRKDLR